ncbi:hypothetical protein SEEM1594_21246 [Salmonella enterica subsp. enterica serovar Muenchen str. baa1594]|nr:hypothetical protein SEEM1594_21246 [Salmonella enterica subsp. enterica serovar Muenchen str. baa1594]
MFILATNDHSTELTMEELLSTYKAHRTWSGASGSSKARSF